jgi:hypothetical protein
MLRYKDYIEEHNKMGNKVFILAYRNLKQFDYEDKGHSDLEKSKLGCLCMIAIKQSKAMFKRTLTS